MVKKWRRRGSAWLLAGAVAVSALPFAPLTVKAEAPAKLAEFTFDAEAEGGVYAGGNAQAAAKGQCQTKVKYGEDSALYLNGADSFINITSKDGGSILKGKENITVSYDAKPEKGEKSWTFFAAPNADGQTYQQEHYLGILHTSANLLLERYNNSNGRPGNNIEATAGSDWMHVDMVVSENATKLYVNGVLAGESASDYKLSDIVGSAGGVLQVGKGNWDNGEYFKGSIDNYRVYDGILSEEEIKTQYQEFEAMLDAIAKAEEEDKKQQEEEAKKQALQKDYDALEILNSDDVRGNLALVRTGRYKSTIEWTSSNPAVVTDSAEGGLYDGGVVTRPEAGQAAVKVTLTAELTSAYTGEKKTKEFEVTVQPKEANPDTDYSKGYLWTNFGTHGGYEKIFFEFSEDGLTWNNLNRIDGKAFPILANDAEGSDLGVRDPHIIRSAEGDRYWILGTDLHAEGGGAGGSGWNQHSASKNLIVWESKDLVNWSEPRLVFAGLETAGCVWAPEAIYDETAGDYVVYWSARDYSQTGTEDDALRVYVCRTRDFNTFSEPHVWLSEDAAAGKEVNIIDTTIVKGDDGKFYRFSTSDWNTVIDVSDTLDTEDVFDVRTDEAQSKPNGSWKRLVTRSGSEAAGFDAREGFTVYKLPDGKWCAMGDNSGYKAFVTDNLAGGAFTAETAQFPDGKFRHGTVMRLSASEQARILEAFKARETKEEQEPVLAYDFEADAGKKIIQDSGKGDSFRYTGRLHGKAEVVYDEGRQSNVLYLDGSDGAYAEIPQGFFDKKDKMSISMDVKADDANGNFFTFAYGKSDSIYSFLRIKGSTVSNAITTEGYTKEKKVAGAGASLGEWQRVVLVIDGAKMKLYLDGSLEDENTNTGIATSDLGTDLLSYLGKSFFGADGYFKGSFDNVKVYNRALTEEEILTEASEFVPLLKRVSIGKLPDNPLDLRGTDDHTAVFSKLDRSNKEIISYVKRGTDLKAVPVTWKLMSKDVQVTVDGKPFAGTLDLSKDAQLCLTLGSREETYTIKKPLIAGNPVLPGQYADPDIDYFDGRFWIFPTTDGYPGWSGTLFHAFSSPDMVSWEDEGIIMELANAKPGVNEKGVQIAASPWAVKGSAWAPTIEAKNGKYYFYYCGKKEDGASAIGVAVAEKPAGPYVDLGEPLMTTDMCKAAGVSMGQAIDPSIFTDTDGKSYILFGNGHAAMAELNEDMVSVKEGTLKQINGLTDFRESVIVTNVDGKYHWTWTCDDANSPNYHVNYGVSDKLIQDDGKINVTLKKKNLLYKDESQGILGSGHQSVLHVQDADGKQRYFMAYHRFYTPLNIFTDAFGVHRETCIDEILFDKNGEMVIAPTLEGVPAVYLWKMELNKTSLSLKPGENSTLKATVPDSASDKSISWSSDKPSVAKVSQTGIVKAKAAGTANITATASNGYQVSCKVTVEKVTRVDKVTLNKKKLVLGLKEEFALKASVSPKNAANASVSWKSDKPKTVYVSKSGKVKALKKGQATITATADGKTAKCTVQVKAAPKKITLNATVKTLKKGKSFQINVKLPKNTASNKITYVSAKKKVASVSPAGKVKALKKGKSVITVKTFNGKKAKLTVTVK